MILGAQSATTDYTWAKTNFDLSPVYSAHKSSNHEFSRKKKKKQGEKKKENTKSILTQIYIK